MITTISAIGRLGNDPEQKVSLKGTEYILFDLAVDRGFGDRKETDWYRCIAFGSVRDRILKLKAAKGSLSMSSARRSWKSLSARMAARGWPRKSRCTTWSMSPAAEKRRYSHSPRRHSSRPIPETMRSRRSGFPEISCPFSPMDGREN